MEPQNKFHSKGYYEIIMKSNIFDLLEHIEEYFYNLEYSRIFQTWCKKAKKLKKNNNLTTLKFKTSVLYNTPLVELGTSHRMEDIACEVCNWQRIHIKNVWRCHKWTERQIAQEADGKHLLFQQMK